MFHRKVYPENTINAKNCIKTHKGKVPHDCFHEYDNGDTTNPDPGRRFHSDSKSRKWSQHCKNNWNPPQHGLSCGSSTGNNEHWIKTDAECKYYIFPECKSSHKFDTYLPSAPFRVFIKSYSNNTEYTV